MDEGLVGEVVHAEGDLPAELQEDGGKVRGNQPGGEEKEVESDDN